MYLDAKENGPSSHFAVHPQVDGGLLHTLESTGLSRPSSFLHRWAPFQPMHWMMGSGPKASFLL